MRSGCRGFESRSGHLNFFQHLFCLYIDRHIRVDLSDDEQFLRNMPCYIQESVFCQISKHQEESFKNDYK